MKNLLLKLPPLLLMLLLLALLSCRNKNPESSKAIIKEMNLKRREVITCGPPDQEFGRVAFETSCE